MSDISKDIFVFLAILLIGAGAFMIGRISVGETERKNELRIISPSNMTASFEQSQLEANSSTGELKITSSGSTSRSSFKSHNQAANTEGESGMYVGSKNGKVYHLPSCPGAKRIKDVNKVWFKDKQDAKAYGYKPAPNCKGI